MLACSLMLTKVLKKDVILNDNQRNVQVIDHKSSVINKNMMLQTIFNEIVTNLESIIDRINLCYKGIQDMSDFEKLCRFYIDNLNEIKILYSKEAKNMHELDLARNLINKFYMLFDKQSEIKDLLIKSNMDQSVDIKKKFAKIRSSKNATYILIRRCFIKDIDITAQIYMLTLENIKEYLIFIATSMECIAGSKNFSECSEDLIK